MKTVHFDNPKGEWFPKMHFLHVKHTFEHVGANYMCISCLRLVRMFLFVYSCIIRVACDWLCISWVKGVFTWPRCSAVLHDKVEQG